MDPQTPAPSAPADKKRNLVPIIIVVAVVVIIGVGLAAWRLTSDSSESAGKPAGQSAKALFKAWQDDDRAAAAVVATPDAVTAIFAIDASEASGLEFAECTPTGDGPFPKECVWTRPGGELTMTVEKEGDTPEVTNVDLGAAGLPPDTSG
jgi:hypothetical protein